MPGFRRAHLRGSDELFRPTQMTGPQAVPPVPSAPIDAGPSGDAEPATVEVMVTGMIEGSGPRASSTLLAAATQPSAPSPAAQPEAGSVRLTREELTLLADAVQRLKFPQHRAAPRPSLVDFERLEQLRQKLLSSR